MTIEFTPLTLNSADRLAFSLEVARQINPYFSQPYADATKKNDIFYALLCSDNTQVYRPNHSLAHGLRQAYLAVDLMLLLRQQDGTTFSNPDEGQKFVAWVKAKLNNDKNFLKKIEFANAFQRSGRQSEVSRRQNPEKYEAYLLKDQENFLASAASHSGPGKLFDDPNEVDVFKDAITKKFDKKNPDVSDDLFYLSKIFLAAHLFDLRRIPHFNKIQVQREISEVLFGVENANPKETEFLGQIWARAGHYLKATGDRDMDNQDMADFNKEVFCAQAHNPELMVKALMLAKTKPEDTLLRSILGHASVMRELKERFGAPPRKLKANPLRETLKNAPYTSSEAYLRILLGSKYSEIPKEADITQARELTKQNVLAFLMEPKRVVDAKTDVMGARVENPDPYYVDVLVDAMMKEREHRDKIVFYHSTEPETGFLFDVYSTMRNQLEIAGGKDIRTLRAIDKEFLQFNEEVQQAKSHDAVTEQATVRDFMKKFKGIGDDDNAYRTMGLSTNFSLFGSDQQKWADTYNMFYLVKDRPIATQPIQNDKFFSYVEQYTGIPMDYRDFQPILDRSLLTCDNQPCRNGRLIQIFVDPSVVDDVAYFSVLLGAPVLKNDVTPNLSEPITLLRNTPLQLASDYLNDTKGAMVSGASAFNLRPNQLLLHDLQARLFMRPDIMFDARLVKINSFFRFDMANKAQRYRQEIANQVNKSLIKWFKLGAPSDPAAFLKGLNNLQTLVNEVYRSSTGQDAPKAQALPLNDQLVKLLLDKRFEHAKEFFSENYEALKDQTFTIPANQNGQGGGKSSLADLYRYLPMKSLFETAFKNGLYPGKESALKVIELLHPWDYRNFIPLLKKLKNPELSCALFLKHFGEKVQKNSYTIPQIIKTIASFGNDESIINDAWPLVTLFDYDCIEEALHGVAYLPAEARETTIADAINLIREEVARYRTVKANIAGILEKIYQYREESSKKKKLMWTIAEQLERNWEERLYLIDGIAAKDEESLTVIADRLKDHSDRIYREHIKDELLKSAFDVVFAPLKSFDSEQGFKEKVRENTESFTSKYFLRTSLEETGRLLSAISPANEIELALNKNALRTVFQLVKSNSLEKRNLVLSSTKKIMSSWNNWVFGISMINRLNDYPLEMLREFEEKNISAEKIVNTPLTEITWKKDNSPDMDIKPIMITFDYNGVLRHIRTEVAGYNMEFLRSIEGTALINTFIVQLNAGFMPSNVCPEIASAWNRTESNSSYNKSLIAQCVSGLAQEE